MVTLCYRSKTHKQGDQIGGFWKLLLPKFVTKVAQKIANFLGYFVKLHSYIKTVVATFWAILETVGLLFTPASGHTAHQSTFLFTERMLS